MSRPSYTHLPRGFKMSSTDEKVGMEFSFVRENSVSQQEKVKAFWKFLECFATQNALQPHKGLLERASPPEQETSVSSVEEIMKEKDIWRKGLRIFQQFDLDKTALAANNRCGLCLAHKTIRYEDLADTVAQPYEELNTDMKVFEQRQKSRDLSQRKAPYAANKSKIRCNSCRVKTKK